MTEAALGLDSESLTGALRVYESLGFRSARRDSVWRKAMPAWLPVAAVMPFNVAPPPPMQSAQAALW